MEIKVVGVEHTRGFEKCYAPDGTIESFEPLPSTHTITFILEVGKGTMSIRDKVTLPATTDVQRLVQTIARLVQLSEASDKLGVAPDAEGMEKLGCEST